MSPRAHVHRRTSCRLCDSAKLELVVPLQPIPLAEKYVSAKPAKPDDERYPIDLYMCRDCGHAQLIDVVDPNVLWADFTFWSGQAKKIVDHLHDCADQAVAAYKPAKGSLVLDVGSNDGTLLKGFQKHGLEVLGVDPAKEIAAKATESGVETWPEFFTPEVARRVKKTHGPAKIVTCFNAFAHADDMQGLADGIREALAPDGVFVFEVSYLLDIVDDLLVGVIFHEHMSHHSMQPMASFLKRHGMELIDLRRVPMQGGSVVGTAQLIGGPHKVQPSVKELLGLEKERGLEKPEMVKEMSTRLKALKAEMERLVAQWKREGKTIAAYGASRSGPTLVGELGLHGALDFIMDDHPQKVNKFSPGDYLPVLPTAELYKRKPDYVVILAWVHAEKIIADNRKYLEQGGHFVLCCPEVKVIGAKSAETAAK